MASCWFIGSPLLALGLVLGVHPLGTASAEATEPPHHVPLSVGVEDAAGATRSLPEGTRVTATHHDGAEVQLTVDRREMQVLLPAPGRWRVCLAAEGLWSDCRTIEVRSPPPDSPEGAPSVTFTAWPTALVRGRLRAAEGGGVPDQLGEALRVAVGPPPGQRPPRGFKDAQLHCSVGEEGDFSCAVPATPLYLAVRLSGYVSRYFWGLDPQANAQLDLGTVRLERGASLAGELDLAITGLETDLVAVRLTPAVGADTRPAVARSLEKDSQVTSVTPLGFFQLGGVRPGSYMLEVKHPGFATTELGPFEVFEGKETRLRDPVRLTPPVDITLLIEPARSPLGRPWRVDVFRQRDWSAGSDRVFSGEADPAGGVELARQSPGLFEIMVADQEGNRYHSSQARIEPGESGFLPIKVSIVLVRGEVRLGSDPVPAILRFGGEHGALRSRMTADEEGAFSGALPREGEWLVEIESAEPAFSTIRRVEVDAGADGEAELDIELENTELVGRVVAADGKPVPDAQVKVDALSELVSKRAQSDEVGEFRFRALPGGDAMVTARAVIAGRKTTSSPLMVSLQDDLTTGPVELVLQPMHAFEGRVSGTAGPVPGARIQATILDLPIPAGASAVSDFEGRFVLELPLAEGVAALTILPPGGFLTTSIRRLESPLELPTAPTGGTLLVRTPAEGGSALPYSIEREGVHIDPPALAQWARGHGVQPAAPGPGSTATFPRMAEGAYRVCVIDEEGRRKRIRGGGNIQQVIAESTRCATGSLAPGGTLELSLEVD